jgi:hypothetical protein
LLLPFVALSSTAGCSAPVVSPPTCTMIDTMSLQGILDGQAFQMDGVKSDDSFFNSLVSSDAIGLGPDGLFIDSGPPSPAFGKPSPITGALLLPSGSPDQHTWFAFGAGSTVTESAGPLFAFSLPELSMLGTCPAAPSSGSLSFCFDDDTNGCGNEMSTTVGSVGGASFDWSSLLLIGQGGVLVQGNKPPSLAAIQWTNGALLVILPSEQGSSLVFGLLRMPASGPDPGAYYCVGSTKITGFTQEFGDLTRLGTAAEGTAAGSLDACFLSFSE